MKGLVYLIPVLVAASMLFVCNSYAQFSLVYVGSGIAINQQGGLARGVAVSGQWAYLANDEDGLRIFDVSDPTHPREVWHFANPYSLGAFSHAVCVSGQYAYLANGWDGLRIFNVANPTNTAHIAHISPGEYAVGINLLGDHAYLPSYDGGLHIIRVSNPTNPIPVKHVTADGGNACAIAFSNDYAYLANGGDGLRIYDISNPRNPKNVGHTNSPDPYPLGGAVDIKIVGQRAYVAHELSGLNIFDISNPTKPSGINWATFGEIAQSVAVTENGRYAFVGSYIGGLHMCDVSDPADIQVLDTRYDTDYNFSLAIQGNYLYVADGFWGLRIYLVQPQLTISLSTSNGIVLSWPQPIAGGAILQQSSSLGSASWLAVTNAPTLVDGRNQLTLAPSASRAFFRLSISN